jgi:hypothetical protein
MRPMCQQTDKRAALLATFLLRAVVLECQGGLIVDLHAQACEHRSNIHRLRINPSIHL